MKKRILAVLMAFTVLVSLFAVPSSASSYNPENADVQKFIKGVESILAGGKKFFDGDITAEEFATHYAEDIIRLDLTGLDIATMGGFSDFVQAVCGCTPAQALGIRDYFTDYSQHHGGGSASGQRDEFLKGTGACAILKDKDFTGYCTYAFYCDYIVLNYWGGKDALIANCTKQIQNADRSKVDVQEPISYAASSDMYYFYGDVRTKTPEGGYEEADETDSDSFLPIPIIPPSIEEPQDIDLYEFLNDFINKLNIDYPDLSTVEGLLASILNGLSNIDSDDDGALLSQINLAIVSLAADSNLANAQIINCLNDLKELLTPKPSEGGEDSGEGETTATEVDLKPIIEQLTKANASLDYLCLINTVDVVGDNVNDLTDTEKEFLDKYATFIVSLIKKFGLEPINNLLTSLGSIIFNDNPPAPLVVNMYGSDITFLSPDMFTPEAEQYIGYAQIFISILLVYSFCLMMRKKIVGEG